MWRRAGLFSLTYLVLAALGRAFVFDDTRLAVFWPASGIAVWWALLARSRRELAAMALLTGGIVASIFALEDFAPGAVAMIALGNVVTPLGTRFGMDMLRGERRFETAGVPRSAQLRTMRDASLFLVANASAVLASAFLTMLGIWFNGDSPSLGAVVAHFFRNTASVIVITAAGLMLTMPRRQSRPTNPLTVVASFAATAGLLWFDYASVPEMPLAPALLLPLVWSALTLSQRWATLHALVTSVVLIAMVHTVDYQPFGPSMSSLALATQLQVFAVQAGVLSLLISTAQAEGHELMASARTAEARARARTEELETITSTVSDGLVVVAADGSHRALNRAAEEALATELVLAGASAQALSLALSPLPPEAMPSARALSGEVVTDQPVVYLDPVSGSRRVFEVTASPLPGDSPQALLLLRDATERFDALDELRRARDHAVRLFEDAPHGVVVVDPDTVVLEQNQTFVELFHGAHLVGSRLSDLEATGGSVARLLHRARSVGGRVSDDVDFVSPDGHAVELALSAVRLALPGTRGRQHFLLYAVDVADRHTFERELTFLAEHDTLTSLLNRYGFEQALGEHLGAYEQTGEDAALLLLDLDNFKAVNDTLGHRVGDELLMQVGTMLSTTLRREDVVARLGGDEFGILMPGVDRDAAAREAGLLIDRIGTVTATVRDAQRRVTASIGVVTLSAAAARGEDPMVLADMLMYDAKGAGRNTVVVIDEAGTPPRIAADLAVRERLERALDDSGFVLHLQPLLQVRTGRVTAAEALVRMRDGDRLVSPGEFMSVAERGGLSLQLDAWVVGEALSLLARLQERDPRFGLSANVAGSTLGHDFYDEALAQALEANPVAPGTFFLELTETAAVENVEVAQAFARNAKERGVGLALDDFGAGYGSFSYLKHLDFDYLKIDGDFVRQLPTSDIDQSIVGSLVALAKHMGKRTVAEHVEDEAVLAAVRQQGVDYAQGYAVGRPMPYEEFVARFLPGEDGRGGGRE